MARQVLPLLGAGIGAIVGAGSPFAIQAGYLTGSFSGDLLVLPTSKEAADHEPIDLGNPPIADQARGRY